MSGQRIGDPSENDWLSGIRRKASKVCRLCEKQHKSLEMDMHRDRADRIQDTARHQICMVVSKPMPLLDK